MPDNAAPIAGPIKKPIPLAAPIIAIPPARSFNDVRSAISACPEEVSAGKKRPNSIRETNNRTTPLIFFFVKMVLYSPPNTVILHSLSMKFECFSACERIFLNVKRILLHRKHDRKQRLNHFFPNHVKKARSPAPLCLLEQNACSNPSPYLPSLFYYYSLYTNLCL